MPLFNNGEIDSLATHLVATRLRRTCQFSIDETKAQGWRAFTPDLPGSWSIVMVRRGPESVCEAEKWASVKLHSNSASDSPESEEIERGERG